MMATERATSIGIDFGTSNSRACVFQDGKVDVIPNDWGGTSTPSYVAFTENGCVVGDAAKNQVTANPENTAFNTKRLIGDKGGDSSFTAPLPWKFVDDHGRQCVRITQRGVTKVFRIEEIFALTLAKLKGNAEAHLNKKVDSAVVSVPAGSTYKQRQSIKDAGSIAGFDKVWTITASTAAGVAYGFQDRKETERNILVFDLGAGSLSVSILNVDDGIFEVKSTAGDIGLGGEDFVESLVNHFVQEFEDRHGKNIQSDWRSLAKLRSACEHAVKALSSADTASIDIESFNEDIDFHSSVTRAQFEELNSDRFQRTLDVVKKAIQDAKLRKSKLDEILIVGGASAIPRIQTMLQEFLGGKDLKKITNPDQAVACGAAIQAAILSGDRSEILQEILLVDAAPVTLGVEAVQGAMASVIKRNTSVPIKNCQKFTTFSENPAGLVPDCQAEMMLKQREEHERHNCHHNKHQSNKTPLSTRPLTIPIKVYEGENTQTLDNNLLAKLELHSLPQAASGVPKIAVTFDIPASDGVLHISAVHENSGTSSEVTVGNKIGFSDDELENMRQEMKQHLKEDAIETTRISSRNNLQRSIDSVKNPGNDEILKKIILQKCMLQHWLDTHQDATKEEFESTQKDFEAFCESLFKQ